MARTRTARKAARSQSDGGITIATTDGNVIARVPQSAREQIRYLWTRLQVQGEALPQSIGVTAQNSGDGVTYTSLALATVLSRTGETCLVEADWWGEGLPIVATTPGLAGLLSGSVNVADALVPTNHPGLTILPAGELIETGQAVMATTEAMTSIVADLHEQFRHVVLDLPAIANSAVALSFASAAEATLLVTRQRVSRIDDVNSAVDDLRHTRLLGVVVNDHRLSMPGFLRDRLLNT